MTIPASLIAYADKLGRRAGLARRAGLPYEPSPWRMTDPSPTKSRLATAWVQAFATAANLPATAE